MGRLIEAVTGVFLALLLFRESGFSDLSLPSKDRLQVLRLAHLDVCHLLQFKPPAAHSLRYQNGFSSAEAIVRIDNVDNRGQGLFLHLRRLNVIQQVINQLEIDLDLTDIWRARRLQQVITEFMYYSFKCLGGEAQIVAKLVVLLSSAPSASRARATIRAIASVLSMG